MWQGPSGDPRTTKWAEAIRRSRIIRAYLRLEKPGVAEADAAAKALGVGRRNFYHLIRAFTALKSDGPPRRVASAIEHIIDGAIDRCGPYASINAITVAAQEAARADGAQPPARKTVKLRVAGRALSAGHEGRIVIDHAPLLATATAEGRRTVPHVTVAIAPVKGVIGLVVSEGEPSDITILDVMIEAWDERSSDETALEVVSPVEADDLSRRMGRPVQASTRFPVAGSAIGLMLMGRVGGIPVAPRLGAETILARTRHLPESSIGDIEAHLRHKLGLSGLRQSIRELRDAEEGYPPS